MPVSEAAHLVAGTAWGAARLSARSSVRLSGRLASSVLGLALRPPLVPRQLQPANGIEVLVARWQRDLPPLDDLVAEVVRRLGIEAITLAVLRRLDLTTIASTAIGGTDLDRVVKDALGLLDVDQVADQLLDQLDLTALVLDRVDLERVVAGALARLDLTAIVVEEVDLLSLAEYVVEGIDLPEIIRHSTGSVASEAVRGLRMQGVDADVVVGRAVDRMLHRRRQRQTGEGAEPVSVANPPTHTTAGTPG